MTMRTSYETGVALCSTIDRAKEAEALRALLDGHYYLFKVRIDEDSPGGPTVSLAGDEWPLAVPDDRYPEDAPDPVEDADAHDRWFEAVYFPWSEAVFEEEGE